MLNPNSFLHRINIKKLYIIFVMLATIFLLAGGISALFSYINNGGPTTYEEYRMNTLAPLFGGSIMMGSFGLLYAYKNRGNAICLFGFFVTLFCYGFIEYLFQFGVA
jgi:hypothetical protein